MSEKEIEVAEKVEVEVTTEAEPLTPEATEYSQEDVDDFMAEQKKKIVDLESQVKGLSKKQSEATLEANRLRTRAESSGNIETLEAVLKAIPPTVDEFGKTVSNPEIKKAQEHLARLKQQERNKQFVAYQEGERQKMRKEAEDAGLDPDGDELALVELAWDNNNPAVAKKWLDKAITKHQKEAPKERKMSEKENKKQETEEEIRADERDKVVKELTKQDVGSPAGSSGHLYTGAQIGDMSYEEWVAAGKPKAKK